MELLIVVTIVATIAVFAVSRMGQMSRKAKRVATEQDLQVLRTAFTDPGNGYLRDMRGIPGFSPAQLRLANLLVSTNLYGALKGQRARLAWPLRAPRDGRVPVCGRHALRRR